MVNNQDFYNAEKRDIEIVRGDTMSFNFELIGLQGVAPDRITFMVKENIEDSDAEALVNCELGNGISLIGYASATDTFTYNVRMRPEMTADLDLARYYYNLQIEVNEDVLTLMKGRFTLDYDVTREGEA